MYDDFNAETHNYRLYYESPEGGGNLGYHTRADAIEGFKLMRKYSPDAYLELSEADEVIKRFTPKRYK